jgi:hypothetical protein
LNQQSSAQGEIVQEIIRERGQMATIRAPFETQYDEIARRIWPMHSGTFQSMGMDLKGDKRTSDIFDSTASIALGRFGAILDSLLTPRNQTWHKLKIANEGIAKNREARLYFDEVTRLLFKYRYNPRANFTGQNQLVYKSLGAYGTGCLFIDELADEPGLRYKNIPLSQIYFAENHQGIIDKALRYFPLKARQAVQQFGPKCPARISEVAAREPERDFFFIHCVKPRMDYDPKRRDFKSMRYASYYICADTQEMVAEGGFSSLPYSAPRYEQIENSPYGSSPAMDVLPAIKTLNEQKKTILKQGHRAVDPILLMHDDGILSGFDMTPGAENYGGVNADGRPLVHTLPIGNIAIGKDLMDDERDIIKDGFLVTLFQILVENNQMTATEVLERAREKGILLAPTVGRQESEYLGPTIGREIDVLNRQGLLPPMPDILREAGGEYNLFFDSPLSRTQRAQEAAGLMRSVETSLNIAKFTGNMEPLDHYNWDVIIPEVSDIQGVPAKWMNDIKKIQEMRKGRQQQQQTEQMIQAAPGVAAMTNAMSKAKGA